MAGSSQEMTKADLVETFGEGAGVELARQVVDDAIGEAGYDPAREAFSATEVIEICESVRRNRSGFVEMQATELQVKMRAERQFGVLFNNIPDPAVNLEYRDGEPLVRSVNRAFETEFGVTGDVVGTSLHDVVVPSAVTRPDEAAGAEGEDGAEDAAGADGEEPDAPAGESSIETFRAAFDRALRSGEKLRREIRVETDHGARYFVVHAIPNRGARRKVSGYAIYADITEVRERERELTRQNRRLEEFASFVSHDLRNPLNVAHGYLELSLGGDADPENLRKAMDSLERMERLISELLVLAREGKQIGDPEAVPLDEAAREAWSTVDTADSELAVASSAVLRADREQFRRLLENLFRNAIDHAGPESTVRVGTLDDESVGFYVEDDGPGIPADVREKVFETGFTTAEGGTGFGLGIVEQIVTAHGWEITVVEGRDGGARFEVTGVERA